MSKEPMHKDLSVGSRADLEHWVGAIIRYLDNGGQSLAIGRECLINAFDKAAAELDGGEHG